MPLPNIANLLAITLIAYSVDNQDGSFTTTLFNNREELAKDLEDNDADCTVEEIENGDDPYENGTLAEITLELELDPSTGAFKLTHPFSFSSDG